MTSSTNDRSYLQRTTYFLGGLQQILRGQPEGVFLVRSMTFGQRDVEVETDQGQVMIPIDSEDDQLWEALGGANISPPSSDTVMLPLETLWQCWVQLIFHFAATSNEMGVIVPGLWLRSISLDEDYVVEVRLVEGDVEGIARLLLTEIAWDAALPMDLAEAFLYRRRPLEFGSFTGPVPWTGESPGV